MCGVDVVENHLRVETLGMLLKTRHQIRALHPVRIGRPVFNIGGGHQLPALLQAGNQSGVQIGTRCVDRRRIACWAGT